jgi:hypothetical protein
MRQYYVTVNVRVEAESPQIARNSVGIERIGSGSILEWYVIDTVEVNDE